MAARIVQDIKTYRAYRPAAPLWLKLAYFASVLALVVSAARVAYEYQRGEAAIAKATEDRKTLIAAAADVTRFSSLFQSYDQQQRFSSSRKEWLAGSPNAAAVQLALIRAVQESSAALKEKKETLSDSAVQMKSMKVSWSPRQDKTPGSVRVDLSLSSSAPKTAALRELNRCLSKVAEALGLIVTSPRWGETPNGAALTLSVELKEAR